MPKEKIDNEECIKRYKNEIKEIIEHLKDETLLKNIYSFMKHNIQ